MKTETRLNKMKGNQFIYKKQVVELLDYILNTGDDADEYELLLSNGSQLVGPMEYLDACLAQFTPAGATLTVAVTQRVNAVSAFNPNVIQELREAVLDSIRAVKADPTKVSQAKQVFQGVNTMVNLAKTELDFRRYIDAQNKTNNQ